MPVSKNTSKSIIYREKKELHFFWLLDSSGSMHGEKIDALNRTVREVTKILKNIEGDADFLIRAIEFGRRVEWIVENPLTIDEFQKKWTPLKPNGTTPMSKAIKLLTDSFSVTFGDNMPEMSRPVVVLITDGHADNSQKFKKMVTQFNTLVKKISKKLGFNKEVFVIKLVVSIGEDSNSETFKIFTKPKNIYKVTNIAEMQEVIIKVTTQAINNSLSGHGSEDYYNLENVDSVYHEDNFK